MQTIHVTEDPRFTFVLISDVADALGRHGYPNPADPGSDMDLVELRQMLHRLLYCREP